MTKKIYIDWEAQSYYTSLEDVRHVFEEDGYNYPLFEEYLNDNYDSVTIFEFTADEREAVKIDFEKTVLEAMEDWVRERMTVVEVEVEVKEK